MPVRPAPSRPALVRPALAAALLAALTACGSGGPAEPVAAVAPGQSPPVAPPAVAEPTFVPAPGVPVQARPAPARQPAYGRSAPLPAAPSPKGPVAQYVAVRPGTPKAEQPPAAPADAATAGRVLADAERVVRDPAAAPADVDAAAWAAQVAYRTLGRNPAWDATALAAVPADLRAAVKRNVAARRAFADLAPDPLPTKLPAWRIVEPLPADTLRALYAKAEKRFGVEWEVLAAINVIESGTGRIVGLSSAGAKGPMQFMPATWRAYGMGGDVWDPEDAILGAANYLKAMGATDGQRGLRRALYRYNNHPAYVRGVLAYANVMRADALAYRSYHAWRIYYRTQQGDVVLPVGYESRKPVPVRRAVR